MAPPACPLGSHKVVSLRPWSTAGPRVTRGSPCRLTWAEQGDGLPPAPGDQDGHGAPEGD